MRLTASQLRQIIQEELIRLTEQLPPPKSGRYKVGSEYFNDLEEANAAAEELIAASRAAIGGSRDVRVIDTTTEEVVYTATGKGPKSDPGLESVDEGPEQGIYPHLDRQALEQELHARAGKDPALTAMLKGDWWQDLPDVSLATILQAAGGPLGVEEY